MAVSSVHVVERDVEHVEIAQLWPAGSVTLRLAIIGTVCSVRPPCERSGSVRPDRSCRARLVPSTLWMVESATMSPMRSGGRSKRLQASSRVSATSMPSTRGELCDHVRGLGAFRQINRRERAERAVMGDIRIGDRQDHPRLVLAEPLIEQVLQIDHVRLAVRQMLVVHAVIGGHHQHAAEPVELRRHIGPSWRRRHSRHPSRARPCAARNRWWTDTSGPAARARGSKRPPP